MSSPFHDDVEEPDVQVWSQAYLDQVRATVRDHGWAIQGVFATDTSHLKFDYCYTIGLIERMATAELLVVGLPLQVGAAILNQIASRMLNFAELIPPNEWDIDDGYAMKAKFFIPRRGTEPHVGVARAYYNSDHVPMAQYVWPDEHHNYPWDEGWDPRVLQPVGNQL